jgi:hypothetical protein
MPSFSGEAMARTSIDVPPSRAETLDEVWRLQTQRTSRPTLVVCVLAGVVGLGVLIIFDDFRFASLLLLLAGAFGVDGLAYRANIPLAPLERRRFHLVSVFARALAIGAALLTGLLVLQAIFGDGIEVMRR